jgi:hypothetical protein
LSTPVPVPPVLPGAAAPWYTSAVQRAQLSTAVGALVALSPKLGTLIGVQTSAQAAMWVESVAGAFTVIAPILGMIWRAVSKLQPLTLTRGNADVHPATIAAERAAAVITPVFPVTPGVSHAPPPPPPAPHVSFSPDPKP